MINRDSDFFKLSKVVAERFLQTTVIIDDEASFEISTIKAPVVDTNEPLIEPPGKRRPGALETKVELDNEPLSDDEADQLNDVNDNGSHILDATTVVDSFARKGIICSVLRPTTEQMPDIDQTLHALAGCADIVVIDWSLHKYRNGEKALDILEAVAKPDDSYSPKQLRLFAIYTAASTVDTILKRVHARLKKSKITVEGKDNGLTLEFESNRLVILFKQDANDRIDDKYRNHVVPFDKLVERLTEEFAEMTSGLVSNAVLASFAHLRENTHKVLGRFSKDLDAPFLTHRILQVNPEDAEAHLVDLIAEEFRAILEEASVGSRANIDAISDWCEAYGISDFSPMQGNNPANLPFDRLLLALNQGLNNLEDFPSSQLSKYHKKPLTKHFQKSDNDTDASRADECFANLTTMRSFYSNTIPHLNLGTVLKSPTDEFLVCIQPRCDTGRINDERTFLFLPLVLPKKDNPFHVILSENNQFIHLAQSMHPYDLRLLVFKVNDDDGGIVKGKCKKDELYFKAVGIRNPFKWMGELRYAHAQRLANDFAAQLARIGLNESEWLRRWAKRD